MKNAKYIHLGSAGVALILLVVSLLLGKPPLTYWLVGILLQLVLVVRNAMDMSVSLAVLRKKKMEPEAKPIALSDCSSFPATFT